MMSFPVSPESARFAASVSTLPFEGLAKEQGRSVDECLALVAAASRSQAQYMMAENYIYVKPNVLVAELARRGLFGEVYYAEGEYLHELKELNEITPWRRRLALSCSMRPTARSALAWVRWLSW